MWPPLPGRCATEPATIARPAAIAGEYRASVTRPLQAHLWRACTEARCTMVRAGFFVPAPAPGKPDSLRASGLCDSARGREGRGQKRPACHGASLLDSHTGPQQGRPHAPVRRLDPGEPAADAVRDRGRGRRIHRLHAGAVGFLRRCGAPGPARPERRVRHRLQHGRGVGRLGVRRVPQQRHGGPARLARRARRLCRRRPGGGRRGQQAALSRRHRPARRRRLRPLG